jgi:iron-sulfur cluster assembly protein
MKALASMAARSCLLKHLGPKLGAAKKRAANGLSPQKGRTCHGTTTASGLLATREDSGRRLLSLSVRSHAQAEEQEGKLAPCITLTENALAHLNQLKEQKASTSGEGGEDLLLRIGIKQGGCSGMSYFMDFEAPDKVVDEDAVMELQGDMKLVCDPKSLLYLFGMELDYSNELIGGGFKFSNPNADSTCGCGKSFSV